MISSIDNGLVGASSDREIDDTEDVEVVRLLRIETSAASNMGDGCVVLLAELVSSVMSSSSIFSPTS